MPPGLRVRALGAALLLAAASCDTASTLTVNAPSLGLPGTNRPPLILSQSLIQTASHTLFLQANAIDLDGDGLVVSYEQIAGPTATERQFFRVGGSISATLDIPADATYAFRIFASDGFFYTDARVSAAVTTPGPPPFDPTNLVGTVSVSSPALGNYAVTITGQVTDRSGNLGFSQPATVRIEPPPLAYTGRNPVVLRIDTAAAPNSLNATGALALSSTATRGGQPADAFSVVLNGSTLAAADGAVGVPLAAGVFRPGPAVAGAVIVSRVDATIVVSGNVISGRVSLLDVSGSVAYVAQFSGSRAP